MTEVKVSEQWLRELFAAELEKAYCPNTAQNVRSYGGELISTAAIAAMKVATGELLAALIEVLVFCDDSSENETEWEQAVSAARAAVAKAKGQKP